MSLLGKEVQGTSFVQGTKKIPSKETLSVQGGDFRGSSPLSTFTFYKVGAGVRAYLAVYMLVLVFCAKNNQIDTLITLETVK